MARLLASGALLAMETSAEVSCAPKAVPSFGRTEKDQRSPRTVVLAGTLGRLKRAACSTPFLNQRISLPDCASPSTSA